MPTFQRDDLTLSYSAAGDESRPTVVFLHGLLLGAEMMEPLARCFADRFHVVNFELHGHGRSSRPHDPALYTIPQFALDLLGLIDHLGLERVGLFGTSLGADVALETMVEAPGRIAAAVLEMPVLDQGAKVAKRMFKPIARGLRSRYGARAVGSLARRIPSWPPGFPEAAAVMAEDPLAAAAVIDGLLADAEHERWEEIRTCPVPTLVIGHRFDPLHAYGDAAHVAARLPNATLIRARSVLELRLRPGRLLARTIAFMEEAFDPETAGSITTDEVEDYSGEVGEVGG